MSKKIKRLIDNPMYQDVKTLSFLSGLKELHSEIKDRDFRLDADLETLFGPLHQFVQQGGPVGFNWHTDADWDKALKLKKQVREIGYYCKIQKRYSIPAKTKNKVIWKKYKGLSWSANGSPDFTNVYIEISLGNNLNHPERV
jgi:hypothetical protein